MNSAINYQTDRLITINYPTGAGGKFISLCLAVAENVLHQDYKLAKIKIQKNLDETKSFDISHKVLNKSSAGHHFELGCREFANFNVGSKERQEELANDLWIQSTKQQDYFFCMMNNRASNSWKDYPNAKHIILKNYDWILKNRNIKIPLEVDKKTFDNYIEFDMESCKEKSSFVTAIDEVCNYLNIKIKNKQLLDVLRLTFLQTFVLGFGRI